MDHEKIEPLERFHVLGEWPESDPEFITELISSAFDIIEDFFGRRVNKPVIITNIPLAKNPVTCYELKDNCYQVNLCAQSGSYWCQIIYQLAHELCHICSNYSASLKHKHKWFEESLCEMCSIATLIELSNRWDKSKLSLYDKGYSHAMKNYAHSLNSMSGYIPDSQKELSEWLSSNIGALQMTCENRELNGVMAGYLYKKLFSSHPTGWICVGQLNEWDCHQDLTFTDHKESWRKRCENSVNINRILELL